MRTRKLGKSGIEVAEIGLGTWGLSGEGYGPVEHEVARKTVEAAMDEGVNFVETAACYGVDGAIEHMLGEVLKSRGRESLFVCTRIGVDRDGEGRARKRFDKAAINEMTETSLKRMETDYVDALMLHNPLPETLDDSRRAAMDALSALREQGKAKLIGVSAGNDEVARAALRCDIDLLEIPYNLLYSRLLHSLAGEISVRKVAVVVRSPLAYGLLGDGWAADRKFGEGDHRSHRWSPAELAKRVRQREASRYLVRGEIKSLREAAIRFVLANQLVSVVAVGARTPEQAVENAHAADVLPYLPPEDLGSVGYRMRMQGVE